MNYYGDWYYQYYPQDQRQVHPQFKSNGTADGMTNGTNMLGIQPQTQTQVQAQNQAQAQIQAQAQSQISAIQSPYYYYYPQQYNYPCYYPTISTTPNTSGNNSFISMGTVNNIEDEKTVQAHQQLKYTFPQPTNYQYPGFQTTMVSNGAQINLSTTSTPYSYVPTLEQSSQQAQQVLRPPTIPSSISTPDINVMPKHKSSSVKKSADKVSSLNTFTASNTLQETPMKRTSNSDGPRVMTTMWEDENTLCYQVEANGISVIRRADNDMINGTKLLNVAKMTRGRRDGILKTEKIRHVVKIGSMHLKGVWIPFDRALAMAEREKIVDLLFPLFVRDIQNIIQQTVSLQPQSANTSSMVTHTPVVGSQLTSTHFSTSIPLQKHFSSLHPQNISKETSSHPQSINYNYDSSGYNIKPFQNQQFQSYHHQLHERIQTPARTPTPIQISTQESSQSQVSVQPHLQVDPQTQIKIELEQQQQQQQYISQLPFQLQLQSQLQHGRDIPFQTLTKVGALAQKQLTDNNQLETNPQSESQPVTSTLAVNNPLVQNPTQTNTNNIITMPMINTSTSVNMPMLQQSIPIKTRSPSILSPTSTSLSLSSKLHSITQKPTISSENALRSENITDKETVGPTISTPVLNTTNSAGININSVQTSKDLTSPLSRRQNLNSPNLNLLKDEKVQLDK